MLGKIEMRTSPGGKPRDGRHCDLCGCSQPAVRCDKCGCQIFCLSCDDMYHRHPKRRFHLRKAVDPTPMVQQARPVLPVKVAHLNATNPGDPSKMPLPPPRKKKTSLFGSFRKSSPSGDNSPPLPKKEYSWTDRLGGIKKFMSNRPLPPLPNTDNNDGQISPATNGQPSSRGDLTFIHKKIEERPPKLPSRSPRPQEYPGFAQDSKMISNFGHRTGQMQNGSIEIDMPQNRGFFEAQNIWPSRLQNQNGHQVFNTMNRPNQSGFVPPGGLGYPTAMHQSSSATDLHNLHNVEHMPGSGPPHAHYPPQYPMNPHMPPHYPYPMYPQFPNYPQFFGTSMGNLSNPPTTTDGDLSETSETPSRHTPKKHNFRKRAKRSQSVMMDRMAYAGQFYPFGPYPGYGPSWGPPMPMETPSSPASSIRSLNKIGRSRRRKKATNEEDDEEEFSPMSSSPLSRPKSSSSDKPTERTEINRQAPLAKMSSSSEDESDLDVNWRRNKVNTIQKRTSESLQTPSSPAANRKRPPKLKKRNSSKQSDSEPQDVPQLQSDKRSAKESNPEPTVQHQSPAPMAQSPPVPPTNVPTNMWECTHCTFINPAGNRICQVCCKTVTAPAETPVTTNSRPDSAVEHSRKQSVESEINVASPDKMHEQEEETAKKDKQDMAILNSALDEAEKEINRGLEELMKLKDDIDNDASTDRKPTIAKETKAESGETSKPVYKSTGRMRTSILEKLAVNKPQTSMQQTKSTEIQTGQGYQTSDKIIEARRFSNSSTTSDAYNSPLAQSPELGSKFSNNKQKRDSSCQTQQQQQDSLADYLEQKKAAEEAFIGRPVNNFGFGYGDRLDMMTSPLPMMYDRYFGGGLGMMQRSHSRASLFTGRLNDVGPIEYGSPGFGYGGAPMYRSVSRGSLTGDYNDARMSEFHNLRKPDYYLSMEELVERRRQESMRAQGLELVRMIREAEQQGFTADDIQVALAHCGNRSPMEWLQDNWRNMLDSVVTLSTNYGNDKTENDIGVLSECEARDALRLHKGNIWAAVTECVEGRQRKYLELSTRGKFSRKDILDALTSSEGDVEMTYAKLSKSTGKPFLMRIWGSGEGVQNQDGAQPVPEDMRDAMYDEDIIPHRYQKDEFGSDALSDDLWSEGADWEEEDYDEERGDMEDLQTCREDLSIVPQEMMTPESDRSDYMDALALDDRNMSSPSDDVFYVIPEVKPEKKKGTGFLSKLVALRKDSKGTIDDATNIDNRVDISAESNIDDARETKRNGTLNTLKNTFSAIKDTVTGTSKADRKLPCTQPERRTIIVRGQFAHESLSGESKGNVNIASVDDLSNEIRDNVDNTVNIKPEESGLKTDDDQKCKSSNESNLQINTRQTDLRNATEVKKSQSLAEKLKQAKQKYSSRTNLNLTQNQNEEPIPSTSTSENILINNRDISENERLKAFQVTTQNQLPPGKIIEINQCEDKIIAKASINSTDEHNVSDGLNHRTKTFPDQSASSDSVSPISSNVLQTINDDLSETKLIRNSSESKTVESVTSDNIDVSSVKSHLENKSNSKLVSDATENNKIFLTSNVSPISLKTTESQTFIENCAPVSSNILKTAGSDNVAETCGSPSLLKKVPDAINTSMLDKINDSLKLAVERKVEITASKEVLDGCNNSTERNNKLQLNTENKSIEISATVIEAIVSPAGSSLNTSEIIALRDTTDYPETSNTIGIIHSEIKLEDNEDEYGLLTDKNSDPEIKNSEPQETKHSLQLLDAKLENHEQTPEQDTEVEEKQVAQNTNDRFPPHTPISHRDNALNLQALLQSDSQTKSTDVRKEMSTDHSASQNKVLGTDKNEINKSEISVTSNFIRSSENVEGAVGETIGIYTEQLVSDELPKKEVNLNIPQNQETSTSNTTSNGTNSDVPCSISEKKADSSAPSTKSGKQKLPKTGKLKKPKLTENNELKKQTKIVNTTETEVEKPISIVSDISNKIGNVSGSDSKSVVLETETLTLKCDDNDRNNEDLSKSISNEAQSTTIVEISNETTNVTETATKQVVQLQLGDEIESSNSIPDFQIEPVISKQITSTYNEPSVAVGTNIIEPPATQKSDSLTPQEIAVTAENEQSLPKSTDISHGTSVPKEHNKDTTQPTEIIRNSIDASASSTSIISSFSSSNSPKVEAAEPAVPKASTSSSSLNTVKLEVTGTPTTSTNTSSSMSSNSTMVNTTDTAASPIHEYLSVSSIAIKVETDSISEPELPRINATKENTDPSSAEETEHFKILNTSLDVPFTSRNNTTPNQSEQNALSNQENSQNLDSDDSDAQLSDDSRPSSVTPPSPVHALRNRFEGLSGGLRGPVRPQSPFRRMSFNSRKQVIALEKIRDISTEKPWFHQKTVEPVKTVIPKRTIKQQLEMERKVRKMVSDRKCRTYRKAEIVVQLMDMNFEEEEALLAANECATLEQAISYLQQECLLCAGHFAASQIVSMTHCEHRACRECIRAYFTVQIRDRTILDLLCPFCNQPDIVSDEDVAQDYFNHLDIMLKKLVDFEIHELFQRKLRDRVLMKDPNFRWCSQCSSGFISMPNLKRLVCPDCNAVTCASCRRLWERDHQGMTCEEFAALKDASDPGAQAAGLAKLLTEDGIDCPRCHFRYALAKGGCMHFRCIQCQHDFCSGCSRPFKMGQKCGVSEFCVKLGLHAHHPRNCLFYLRDKEPEDLQKLLDMNDVTYNKEPPEGMEVETVCQVMEQKETADGMLDDICGKEVQDGYAGLCRVHYVEYLGQLVNRNQVDPIQIFDNDDLELVLRRASIRLPAKKFRENDDQYKERLIKLIQEELPLDKMDGS